MMVLIKMEKAVQMDAEELSLFTFALEAIQLLQQFVKENVETGKRFILNFVTMGIQTTHLNATNFAQTM